jgi:hypothetical protein
MRNPLFLFIFVGYLLYSSTLLAAEFADINLSGWKKEELTYDHLRFTRFDKKNFSLHLQVDSYDTEHPWEEKTLAQDVADMARIRKAMSFFLGTKDYQIETYKLEKTPQTKLILTGSYKRLGGEIVQFLEINFYYKEHFLQLKIITEEKLPDEKELTELIKEINPQALDVD